MFNYESGGFQFQFDEKNLYLKSSLFNMGPEQQAKLFEVAKDLQLNIKGLCAAGELGDLLSELTTHLDESKRIKASTNGLRSILNTYDNPRGTAQIELWFSYLIEMTPFDMEIDWPVFNLWEFLEEAKAFDGRYQEYKRWVSLSQRFPTAHDGYVYLFRLSTGHYKIGFSNNPQRRGREITSGLPLTLDLIHQIPSNQIACLEHELHEQYKDKRHGTTEWFELSSVDVEAIKAINERRYPWLDNPEWGDEFRINFIPVRANLFLPPKPLAKPESDILAE